MLPQQKQLQPIEWSAYNQPSRTGSCTSTRAPDTSRLRDVRLLYVADLVTKSDFIKGFGWGEPESGAQTPFSAFCTWELAASGMSYVTHVCKLQDRRH